MSIKLHNRIQVLRRILVPRLILVGAFCVLISNNIFAQNIKGVVKDLSTGEPIPYVNIGIIEIQKGTVSNGFGIFSLNYNSISDTVIFSAIGYHQKKISVSDIQNSSDILIQPRTYELEEIVVSAEGYGESKIFGNKQEHKGQSIGFGSGQLGTEIAAKIEIKKKTWIESAHFTVNFTGPDSMKFRLNLYKIEGSKTGENLIKENIIISGEQERGTFSVDFSKFDIVLESDVLLSLEWIDKGEAETNKGMMFRAKKVRKKNANLYLKYTSLLPFKKVELVKYELGFYLVGMEKN